MFVDRRMADDEGRLWLWGDPRLSRYLQSSLDPSVLWPFCIRHLGFIELQHRANWMRVRLDPTTVSSTAVTAVLYWIFDNPAQKAVISSWNGGWADKIVGGPQELINFLLKIDAVSAEPQGTWFDRRRVEPITLRANDPLRALFATWRSTALGSDDDVAELCNRLFRGTFTIVNRTSDFHHVITKQGQGYRIYNQGYMKSAVGTRIEDDPNAQYGRWVAQGLRDAIGHQRPIIEDVNATLVGPDGRRRVSYRRILVPFTSSETGLPSVVTASRLNTFRHLDREVA
jgi:hypothetical protein